METEIPKIDKNVLNFVYQFYTDMKSHEILIAYEGEISHEVMLALAAAAEERMSSDGETKLVRQRVYHVMVECLQNIVFHSMRGKNSCNNKWRQSILLVSHSDKQYHVITGNRITPPRTETLKAILDTVNQTGEEELDRMYKNQILNGKISPSGGAGLGFIDIRRKTGNPLEYHFLPMDDGNAYFLLESMVTRK
jgi:hypothetical protein